MDVKKTQKASVERLRLSIFFGGLVFALAAILTIFQFTTWDRSYSALAGTDFEATLEEEILVTITEVKPPPPPPPVTVEIVIVDDVVDVPDIDPVFNEPDDEPEITYIELDPEIIVEIHPPIPYAEQMPVFVGGEAQLFKFLGKNVKYPAMARDAGISGRVFVTFVIEMNGEITDVKLIRGIGGGCDEEAMRVVKKMPKWKPGKQGGKNVRVQFNLPIFFNLKG
jgi:protein TonB